MRLFLNALIKFLAGFLLFAALIFLPAGTLHYTNGWLLIGLLFIPILIFGTVLFCKAPDMLQKRLDAKEKESTQKAAVSIIVLSFILSFIVAGLDYRFGWSHVSHRIVLLASVILLASYALYVEVMRENTYLFRTVKVQENQTVVDTGLYGIVRHPMYAAIIWLFLAMPVILGSWWALLCCLPQIPALALRIKNEEKILKEGLPGYADYQARVKYRLFPFIW